MGVSQTTDTNKISKEKKVVVDSDKSQMVTTLRVVFSLDNFISVHAWGVLEEGNYIFTFANADV